MVRTQIEGRDVADPAVLVYLKLVFADFYGPTGMLGPEVEARAGGDS